MNSLEKLKTCNDEPIKLKVNEILSRTANQIENIFEKSGPINKKTKLQVRSTPKDKSSLVFEGIENILCNKQMKNLNISELKQFCLENHGFQPSTVNEIVDKLDSEGRILTSEEIIYLL